MTGATQTKWQAAEGSPPVARAIGQDVPVRSASRTGAGPV